MTKPVLEDLLRFSGRRNRKSYVLYSLVCVLGLLIVWGAAYGLTADHSYIVLAIPGLISLIMAISGWAVGSQRCRDFGWTGWAILLTVIPYVGMIFALAIVFIPGTLGANRYGPDPLGRDSAG